MMRYRGLDGEEHIYFYLKDDEHGWLSNFYPSPILIDGIKYSCVENYYQAQKATEENLTNWIAQAPKPWFAMKAGRMLRRHEFQKDWEKMKVDVMRTGIRAKFTQNPVLKKKLLETEDLPLHENSPTDTYWGMKGKDMLGKVLMEIRKEVRENGTD